MASKMETKKNGSLNLADAPTNCELVIIGIDAGKEAKKRLSTLGLQIFDRLIKQNDNKWGPVLLNSVTGDPNKIAIGRRLARKIIVEKR